MRHTVTLRWWQNCA